MTTRGSGQRQASLPASWKCYQRTSFQLHKGQKRKIFLGSLINSFPSALSYVPVLAFKASKCSLSAQQMRYNGSAVTSTHAEYKKHQRYLKYDWLPIMEYKLLSTQTPFWNEHQIELFRFSEEKSPWVSLLNSIGTLNSCWRYQAALSTHREWQDMNLHCKWLCPVCQKLLLRHNQPHWEGLASTRQGPKPR